MLSAALKKGTLAADDYTQMLKWTTTLNKVGTQIADIDGVHAMTDITGFGLAGHLLEMCRGAKLEAELSFSQLPFIETAVKLAQQGIATGASNRNWQSYGKSVDLPEEMPLWQRNLLTDPQTSGGLLVACSEKALPHVQETVQSVQGNEAVVLGRMVRANAKGLVRIIF